MQHVIYKETTMLHTGVANGELLFAWRIGQTQGV